MVGGRETYYSSSRIDFDGTLNRVSSTASADSREAGMVGLLRPWICAVFPDTIDTWMLGMEIIPAAQRAIHTSRTSMQGTTLPSLKNKKCGR